MKSASFFARTALAVAFFAATFGSAHAAAPLQHHQVDGYYRTTVGSFEVTALYDGGVALPTALLQGDASLIQSLLARSFSQDPSSVWATVQGFLINTGDKLVLVDSGTGGHWGGPTLGKLVSNLRAAGYEPEQVDVVLLTHLHPDHVGGIYQDGRSVFPNATVMVNKAEADFWLSTEIAAQAPPMARDFFKVAQAAAAPYIASSHWKPYVGTADVVPGITPYPIPGHTPGHTGYLISSKGQSLLLWGDVTHVVAVQMPHPEIGIALDTDSAAAIRTREELLRKLATDQTMIAADHMPFPGLGRVRPAEASSGYDWVPATFRDAD